MLRNISRRSLLLAGAAMGVELASGLRARSSTIDICVADYGARPTANDARPGIQAAVARLPRTGGARLYFPPGVYRCGAGDEPAIRLEGIQDLTIYAEDVTFLFDKVARAMVVQGCRGLQLRGFSIDWTRPPFSQGEVIAVGSDLLSADVRIDPEFYVDGSEIFSALGTYDRSARLVAKTGIDVYGAISRVGLIGQQLLRLYFSRQLRLCAGDTVVLRHAMPGNYHAVAMQNCDDVQIDRVKIHASCSMALVGGSCRDVQINRLEVTPTPSSSRLLSSNADAIHLGNCSGRVEITDCLLNGMGDDGVNVHGQFLELVEYVDTRTVRVRKKAGETFDKTDLPNKGDHFLISRDDTLEPLGEGFISAAESGPEGTFHFEKDLPANLRAGDAFCDTNDLPSVRVANCRFPGNRARGVLAHSDVEVSNCSFSGQSDEAILLAPDLKWRECGSAERVKIHHNVFQDTNRLARGVGGGITVDGRTRGNGRGAPVSDVVNRDILIESNSFVACNKAGIYANAVDRLTVRSNRFRGTHGPAIELGSVRRVEIAGNWSVPTSVVVVQNACRDQVSLSGNSGLTQSASQ